MITVGVIRNGTTYLTEHLRKNDYWAEGEKEVRGVWIGAGAEALGLSEVVDERAFDALRQNRHPRSGELLTAREGRSRMALFDIQLSAPKDVSVLAMVGGDERVRQAFVEAVEVTLSEMERFAAVRERRGRAHGTEAFRLTRNFVGALFVHDASRDLDPQLHAHAVLANATWDPERKQWMALQQAEMLRASGYLRQVLYRELANRLRRLGYETYGMNSIGFAVRGVEHLRERYSKRSRHIDTLAAEFAKEHGRKPTKREVEVLVRQSRANKLTRISTRDVREQQRAQLTEEERAGPDRLVSTARAQGEREFRSEGEVQAVLEAALRHAYERSSVLREGEVLNAALELHPEFCRWRELREALELHPDSILRHGEMSLRSIHAEEQATIIRVREGRNTRSVHGDPFQLPEQLTRGQREAARALLQSKDFVTVLVGDAGTGKTTVLTAIENAHRMKGGQRFIALAPTTRAREALEVSGFAEADTVQRFLVSEAMQRATTRRTILVDEAGLLSTEQLAAITRIAKDHGARLLLVGDTKQHYSVQRGDALRNVTRHSGTPVVRLSEVLRQRKEADRRFSRLLAAGDALEAFQYAQRRGAIREAGNDEELFRQAAEHYAENVRTGADTVVVIPFWEEIDRFNVPARKALRDRGMLGADEIVRETVKPLTWTDEQKAHWGQYRIGDALLFVRHTRFFARGSSARVVEVLPDGLRVANDQGRHAKITRKQRAAFDVGRTEQLPISVGDRLLIRGREESQGFENGDFRTVAYLDPATNRIGFSDGTELPVGFKGWTYGHALTSYRAQGSTAEESLIVLGSVAERALRQRQFYVGNTRFRGAHHIYVSNRQAILNRLALDDTGRELATEFVHRHRVVLAEQMAMRPLERMGHRVRQAWSGMTARWTQMQQHVRESMRA